VGFRLALVLALIASAAVAVWGVALYGWNLHGLQATTRFSGRLSLALFTFIFLFHPRRKEFLWSILSTSYFLIFAIVHGIHLAELLSYVMLSGIQLVPMRVAGGFLAYALIFAMPLLQYRMDQKKLSEERFRQISYVYLFYVWFVFFMTYLSRVQGTFPNAGGSYGEHVALMAFVNIILGLKIVQIFTRPQGESVAK
jgi:hypothetical protein